MSDGFFWFALFFALTGNIGLAIAIALVGWIIGD